MKKSIVSLILVSMLSGNVLTPLCVFAASSEPITLAQANINQPSPIILPDMGDSSSADLSNIDEKQLGEKIMREIRRDPDYSRDFVLYDYYNQVGKELASNARKQKISGSDLSGPLAPKFEFFGIRDSSINAFALPGGYVGIHSGLVLAAQTESELASVLGHEIGHITQRHIARSMNQGGTNTFIMLASLLLAGLAVKNNPSAAQGFAIGGQALAINNQLSYSRGAEREADRVGFQILQASGFDVNAMADFFQRLQKATGIMDSGVPAYVRTHPLTIDRIAEMQDRARNSPNQKRIPSSLEFYLAQSRAKLEQQGKFSELLETRQYFDAQVQAGASTKKMQGYYGLALLSLKENKIDDAENYLKKSREIAQSLSQAGSPIIKSGIAFEVTTSEIAFARKKYEQAITSAQQGLRLNFSSKAAGVALVEAQLASGKASDAIAWLKQKTKTQSDDADYWDLLARAYAKQNKVTLYHAALAEKYAIDGGLLSAIEQLKIARKENDGDFYQMSEIDARLRQLQSQYREQLKDEGKSIRE